MNQQMPKTKWGVLTVRSSKGMEFTFTNAMHNGQAENRAHTSYFNRETLKIFLFYIGI